MIRDERVIPANMLNQVMTALSMRICDWSAGGLPVFRFWIWI